MKNPTIKDITPEIKAAVSAVLVSRAFHETMKAAVDKVYLEILTECPIYADRRPELDKGRQIFSADDLYLSKDEAACQETYSEANHRLKERGIKPQDMDPEKCPALVAYTVLSDAQKLLVEVAEPLYGINFHDLICSGMDDYRKYIDLLCGLVVSLPDFDKSLAGRTYREAAAQ